MGRGRFFGVLWARGGCDGNAEGPKPAPERGARQPAARRQAEIHDFNRIVRIEIAVVHIMRREKTPLQIVAIECFRHIVQGDAQLVILADITHVEAQARVALGLGNILFGEPVRRFVH